MILARTIALLIALVMTAGAGLAAVSNPQETQQPPVIAPNDSLPGFSRGSSGGAPLSDFVHLRGQRINHLRGIGLVTGLANTGDNQMALFTIQLVLNTLKKQGITLPANLMTSPLMIMANDLATVTVTADMPSSVRQGDRLDVNVAAMGNASSLQGGTLLMTPLQGADGEIYAVAQGPVSIAGYFAGSNGASVSSNFQTSGQIAGGATVERELENDFPENGHLELDLNDPDPALAEEVARGISANVRQASAVVRSADKIDVTLPLWMAPSSFVASLRNIYINPPLSNRVVVNEKTGTVVVGGDVTIGKSAVSYGDYTITIAPELQVSQPNPFGAGRTVVQRSARIGVNQEKSRFFMTPQGATVEQVAATLSAVGVKPTDTAAIFQAFKQAGVLYGELIVR